MIVYWKTKDNRKINIDEMSIEHLRNIVKMIVRQNQDYQDTCPHNIDDAISLENKEVFNVLKIYESLNNLEL
jgi:hypothetical protein